jgi:Na+-driven multidrug efflux pump
MFFTVIAIYIARYIYDYGEYVVAAQRIGVQIEQLTWMIASGFQTAITVFIGQNFGAKAYDRIRKSVYYTSLVLIPYAFIVSALLYFIPEQLMDIFLDNPISIQHGVVYLRIIALSQVFMIIEGIGTGFFNGIARSHISSSVSAIGNSLRIPLVIWLTTIYAERGIWWSFNISSIFKAVFILIFFIFFFRGLEHVKVKKLKLK